MMPSELSALAASGEPIARVLVSSVQGSTPREAGTEMFVTLAATAGTIGGGGLEHEAIQRARALIAENADKAEVDVTLGPDTGQCCGGRVRLSLVLLSDVKVHATLQRMHAAENEQPHLYIFGSGHVGRAIANLCQHLPFRTLLVDQREAELARCSATVTKRLSAIPEAEIANAPPCSAFIILTHDHGLDFLLTEAALARGDAAYVGMIGSATKRAVFEHSLRKRRITGIAALTCPIGAAQIDDKRPEIIAALVLPEVIAALDTHSATASVTATGTRP